MVFLGVSPHLFIFTTSVGLTRSPTGEGYRVTYIAMHKDQSEKAEELVAALGMLARAQELGANSDQLSELTASVQQAEHAFRVVYRPVQ